LEEIKMKVDRNAIAAWNDVWFGNEKEMQPNYKQ
jgi:hypothetical protein